MANNFIGMVHSEYYGKDVYAYRCLECGKTIRRIRKTNNVRLCEYCLKQENKRKIKETNERNKQLLIANAREQRNKELAEIIEDLFKLEIKNSYDEGFNAALMQIHDKVMF